MKKIIVFCLAFVLTFMVGRSFPVYAATSNNNNLISFSSYKDVLNYYDFSGYSNFDVYTNLLEFQSSAYGSYSRVYACSPNDYYSYYFLFQSSELITELPLVAVGSSYTFDLGDSISLFLVQISLTDNSVRGIEFCNPDNPLSYCSGLCNGGIWSESSIDESSIEYSPAYEELGYLRNVTYNKLYTRTGIFTDKLFYRFSWSGKTSTGVDISKDEYDVIYYWECYSIEKTFSGKIKQSDSLFTDKFLVKSTQENYFTILQNAHEGQLSDIFKSVFDTQPPITKDFQVITKLHVAPVYRSGDVNQIGLWTHVTFDNAGTSESVQDTVADLVDGDGLEADFDVETENSDGTSNISHNKNTVGVGSDIDEALNNSSAGNSTILDTDFSDSADSFWQNAEDLVSGIGNIPKLISKVFSFLPSWCLTFVGVCFGGLVFLIIYKVLRG